MAAIFDLNFKALPVIFSLHITADLDSAPSN